MSFNWPSFLTQHNISYITTGKVGRNDLGCACPFCGPADTGHNMSISLVDRGWYCWKQPDGHRGKTPHRLIQALIGCSFLDAETIVKGDSVFIPNDSNLLDQLQALFQPTQAPTLTPQQSLTIPKEFNPIENIGKGRMFVSYLEKRGFASEDIPALVNKFHLRYCTSLSFMNGAYNNRLIFLIEMDRELVSWTGRHIGTSRLRYNSLSTENTPNASLSLKQTILWYDYLRQIKDGETLVVCEGPFDALKVNYLGNSQGIYATCVYGSSLTETQIDLLESLNKYSNRVLLLDSEIAINYECNRKSGFGRLDSLGFKTRILPKYIKDPGELTKETFKLFVH